MKVSGIDLLPLKDYHYRDTAEEEYVSLVKSNLKAAPLYYSHTWDLSNAYQRQSGPAEHVWRKADERFFWNNYVAQDLISAASLQPLVGEFIISFIYGYVNLQQTTIHGKPVTFGLITRRSRWRAGTRYLRRGIDDEGNVANYNETEQIVCIPLQNSVDVQVFSYIQTRGSVPVYWGEVNNLRYRPRMKIGGNPLFSAKKHFTQQEEIYGKNYLVNLVNEKGYESPVKLAYEKVVQDLNNPNLQYVYFDFHNQCSKMRWHRVDILIDQLLKLGMDQQGWYQASVGLEKSVVERVQTSVVRSNCMDCLDRTNVVQSQIARWVLQKQLEAAGVITPNQQWNQDVRFESVFRNMWADNADVVSKSYSGTGALKTDFTRLGKRTMFGALNDLKNSIMRYARNNYADGPRQDGFDLVLGNHLPYETLDSPFTDMRPVAYQAMPFVLVGSFVLVIAALTCPKEDSSWLANRAFVLFWTVLFGYSLKFVFDNGLQYVNWPKLHQLEFVRKVPAAGKSKSYGYIMAEVDTPEHSSRSLEEGKRE